jgi:hypothetical protein
MDIRWSGPRREIVIRAAAPANQGASTEQMLRRAASLHLLLSSLLRLPHPAQQRYTREAWPVTQRQDRKGLWPYRSTHCRFGDIANQAWRDVHSIDPPAGAVRSHAWSCLTTGEDYRTTRASISATFAVNTSRSFCRQSP